ncbi:Cell cycle control protein 50B [Trichostrongylus colubriformis]|uniref:Cell cycle control protein 50B n=1 Tax=Trichostrongylus colubriformis TaxID=6319 RepID=A0AAN8FIS6_TRICO
MPDDVPQIPRKRGKRKQPIDSAWRQQRLPSYRLVITAYNAFPWTTVLGIICLAMGIVLKFALDQSLEIIIEYTNCTTNTGYTADQLTDFSYPDGSMLCHLSFALPENYTGNVKFYYGLREFYQNNRLYVDSRNDVQLLGKLNQVSGCEPLDYLDGFPNITYAPCGFIANSMFNDSFQLLLHGDHGSTVGVPFTTRTMISDKVKKRKFRNPVPVGNETLCEAFRDTVRPPWWQKDLCKLGANTPGVGVGFENIDFIMWMYTSALPHFRKPYRILDREVDGFRDGLPSGMYTLVINYNYPAQWKGAQKSFIITREGWIGARRPFLAFAYIAVGVFLLLTSIVFFVLYLWHRISKKKAQTEA